MTADSNDCANSDSKYVLGPMDRNDPSDIGWELTDSFGDIYRGDTMEELMQKFAADLYAAPNSLAGCQLSKVQVFRINKPEFLAYVSECVARNNAVNEAEKFRLKMTAWEREHAQLIASADDYSESGYAKKLAELMARKPHADNNVT